MIIKYSKKSSDIKAESLKRIAKEDIILKKENITKRQLRKGKERIKCILCNAKLTGDNFLHRKIEFILCGNCGHIQTKFQLPNKYPFEDSGSNYKEIYPKLNKKDFLDRRKRIYEPKLKWILDCFKKSGIDSVKFRKKSWIELGCGAGYFLSTLNSYGISKFIGIDTDRHLLNIASNQVDSEKLELNKRGLDFILNGTDADIYVAFFVLEHIENLNSFFKSLSNKKKDTIFIFSVPMFGMTTIFENVFQHSFARLFDCVIHTQMFTDKSLKYSLNLADFEILGKWIFGQDASDIIRMLDKEYQFSSKSKTVLDNYSIRLNALIDDFQHVIDRHELSDQIHIIARKR